MRCCIALVVAVSVFLPGLNYAAEPNTTIAEKTREFLSEPVNAVTHPILVRVRQDAFGDYVNEKVDLVRPVNRVILGTPVQGTSRTIGTLNVNANARDDAASFQVHFTGRVNINTVGFEGPARVYSRSSTDFGVTRQITFSPLTGFKATESRYQGTTRLVLDDVRSTLPGLRGRIVRRIGWRRAGDSRAIAERISWQHTRDDLCDGFDGRVNGRIAELNRQLNIARYARGILGDSQLEVKICSTVDCIQFALGRATEKSTEQTSSVAITDSPAAPLELWVHNSVLGEQLPALTEALSAVPHQLNVVKATLPMLQALSLSQSVAMEGVAIRFHKDWVIIGLDPNAPQSERTLSAQRSSQRNSRG